MFNKEYISDRLKEPSTWRGGVLFVAGIFGFTLAPDVASAITHALISVAGAIGLSTPDKKP